MRTARLVAVLLALGIVLTVASTVARAQKGVVVFPEPQRSPNLALLLDYESKTSPSSPEDLLSTIAGPSNPTRDQLRERLGNPTRVAPLLSLRKSPEQVAKLPRNGPERALSQYVVLTYENASLVATALEKLKADGDVLWVETPASVTLSAVPNDSLWPQAFPGDAPSVQWGMRAMNFQGAWQMTTGNAYLGHIDNGIQTAGTTFSSDGLTAVGYVGLHPDLAENYRPRWSSNHVGGTGVDEEPLFTSFGAYPYFRYAGHGSHTAGIMAGTANNSVGIAGGCWRCPELPPEFRLPTVCGLG